MLTTVRAVNKTDSATMGADFGSLAAMFRASEQALSTVPGLGPTKVKRLHAAFSTPFLRVERASQAAQQHLAAAEAQAADAYSARPHTAVSGRTENERVQGEAVQSLQDEREWLATQEARIAGEDVADEDDD